MVSGLTRRQQQVLPLHDAVACYEAVADARDRRVELGHAVRITLDVAVHRDRRPVYRLEVVTEGCAVGEMVDGQGPPLGDHVGYSATEQRADVVLLAPQWRWLRTWRR